MAKRRRRSCGIGGQAVLEGVMMKNKDKYAVAVRRSDGVIEISTEEYKGVLAGSVLKKIPYVRGTFNFIDSLVLGIRSLNFSASFYEDEPKEEDKPSFMKRVFGEKADEIMMGIVTVFSFVLALGIFMVLPYYLSVWLNRYVQNDTLLALIEGVIRILIFLLYVVSISLMKDIHRLYQYHGAEHKCINCIERGRELTVQNVKRSSRLHKRCGTSFLLFVMLVSVVLFFFIRVDNPVYRVGLRIVLIPVIAGISYEIIRWAGNSRNFFVSLLSAPGLGLQKLTTKEPDEEMIEVAIASVNAVFDWKQYLAEHFGYEPEENAAKTAKTDKAAASEVVASTETEAAPTAETTGS